MSRMDKTQEQLKAALMAAQGGEQRAVSRTDNPKSPRPGAPRHPIRSMQGPFEESIEDATNPPDTKAQENFNRLDPRKRRQRLLDTDSTNGTYNEQWRTRSSNDKFHPLTKIISQVAFGVHLLHQQLAKSDEEVVKILQKHVDDVDNFVQRAEEDLDLAISDVRERINYLKLPLEHSGVFDVMLDDKAFRTQILVGNEKIEKVVDATTGLVKDLQVDVQKWLESTIDFGNYLDEISDNWPQNDRGSIQIFQTMQANVEGWVQCMSTLQMKGNGLSVAVVQLGSILSEMAKRAASASRREQRRAERSANGSGGSKPRSSSQHSSANRNSRSERRNSYKPLPNDPDLVARVVEATLPGAKVQHHGRSREKHYDEPRQTPQAPKTNARSMRSTRSGKSDKNGRNGRKTLPIHPDKMPTLKKPEAGRSETTMKDKMSGFANVFRFHGSTNPSGAASTVPTPLTSPGLPPPNFPGSQAVSPMSTPRASSVLPPRKFFSPPVAIPQEMEAESQSIFELDNDPQATLIEARHKLRSQQSQDFVVPRKPLRTPTTDTSKSSLSPRPTSAEGEDSAYASSPETEPARPTTSPTLRPPAISSLGIFPSLSMTSLPTMATMEQDRQADKMSITSPSVTTLPILSSPTLDATANVVSSTPRDPSRLRQESRPDVLPTMKKRTSFSALKKFFQRRGASADSTSRIPMVNEVDEKGSSREINKENRMPSVLEQNPVTDQPVELPA